MPGIFLDNRFVKSRATNPKNDKCLYTDDGLLLLSKVDDGKRPTLRVVINGEVYWLSDPEDLLIPPDLTEEGMGMFVKVSGNGRFIFVASPYKKTTNSGGYTSSTGAVYVFEVVEGKAIVLQKIVGTSLYGSSEPVLSKLDGSIGNNIDCSHDGTILAVGTPSRWFSSTKTWGTVDIYEYSSGKFVLRQIIGPYNDGRYVGATVMLSSDGNKLLVTNSTQNLTASGLYYERNSSGSFSIVGDGIKEIPFLFEDGSVSYANFGLSYKANDDLSEVVVGHFNSYAYELSGGTLLLYRRVGSVFNVVYAFYLGPIFGLNNKGSGFSDVSSSGDFRTFATNDNRGNLSITSQSEEYRRNRIYIIKRDSKDSLYLKQVIDVDRFYTRLGFRVRLSRDAKYLYLSEPCYNKGAGQVLIYKLNSEGNYVFLKYVENKNPSSDCFYGTGLDLDHSGRVLAIGSYKGKYQNSSIKTGTVQIETNFNPEL